MTNWLTETGELRLLHGQTRDRGATVTPLLTEREELWLLHG